MPETFPTAAATASTVAEAVDFFVPEALAKAQVALYRGFIHEVNNAVGGVGTLAEAMKGSDPATMEVHLDLISSTMAKTGALEKRLRAMLSAPVSTAPIQPDRFLADYRDLLELMLPRSVKLSFETGPQVWDKSPRRVLEILMVAFAIAREGSDIFRVALGEKWEFDFGVPSPSVDTEQVRRMSSALEALSVAAGFVYQKTPTGVVLSASA